MFKGPFDESIVKKAQEKKLVEINIHNLRKWAIDKRGTVDDRPYGGGKGMLLRPEPIDAALRHLKIKNQRSKIKITNKNSKIILLSPVGKLFNQKRAQKMAKFKWMTLICGHYEGIDYRVHQHLVDEVVSIGDYILTGGEIPAMVLTNSIIRLIPGVLEPEATELESFSPTSFVLSGMDKIDHVGSFVKGQNLLEYPQYTRPENFKGHKVPEILLSGNHQEIEKWRQKKALSRTRKLRPDLLRR